MRQFTYLGFALLFLSLTACTTKTDIVTQRPNILFIAIDDLNDWVSPLAGNTQTLSPHLDQFATTAVNFKRNYCTSPGCNPSRSTLLTGYHTYKSGMYSNYQDWRNVPKLQEALTLPKYFKDNGYYTAGAGKIFHYAQVDTLAWHDYFPSIKNPMPKDSFPETPHNGRTPFQFMYNMFDWAPLDIADEESPDFQSVAYISDQLQQSQEAPFFLACGIYRPHLPWYVPQQYFDLFPLDSIQLPALLNGDTTDLGNRAKELIERGGNYHQYIVESDQWKEAIQGYLASIAYADAMFGKLMQALEDSGQADNTIVVVWSDHGWQLGEKMHWRKFALWENVIRTLLMIRVPEGTLGLPEGAQAGESTESLSSLLDLYPTLVNLCGLPERMDLDGEDLRPLLASPSVPIDRPIITTYDFGDYSLRYGDWHYIQYVDDTEELYQLKNDPHEWYNLSQDPAYDSVKVALQQMLPANRTPLPEASLIPLMEHHIPPVKSTEYYFSKERQEWLKRFKR
jgi:arylsulfatase A-like enzyme